MKKSSFFNAMRKNIFTVLLTSLLISAFGCIEKQQQVEEVQKLQNELSIKKEIEASKLIKLLAEGKDIILADKIIIDDLDFTKATSGAEDLKGVFTHYINSSIVFKNCEFKGKIVSYHLEKQNLHRTFFQKNLTFIQCIFEQEVEIKQSTVQGICNFSESVFNKILSLETSIFYAGIFLDKVTVQGGGRFQNVICFQDFSCMKSFFYAMTSFQRAVFKGNIMCVSTEFYESVDFGLTTMYHDFLFNYNILPAQVSFNYMNCRGKYECLNTKFGNRVMFQHAILEKKVKWVDNKIENIVDFSETTFYQQPKIDTLELIQKKNIYLLNRQSLKGIK